MDFRRLGGCILFVGAVAACSAARRSPRGDVDRDGGPGGIPCRELVDTDEDGVADQHEGDGDPDGDGLPSDRDLDADGDGIADADERGPSDPERDRICTPPRRSDTDPYPDLLDTDSDNDGLLDLFVGNEDTQSQLFLNVGGTRFHDISQTAGVDRLARVTVGEIADFGDAATVDGHVRAACLRAGAVDEHAPGDHEIVHSQKRRSCRRGRPDLTACRGPP